MIYSIYELLYIFAVYAFLGWLLEVVFVAATRGGFDNRGFLNGPACPIYGFGALFTLLILTPFRSNFLAFFACAVILATLLELTAGFILEKVFHEKWWDYKDEPLNFYGYICMKFSLAWGVGCAFLMYILHPLVIKFFVWIPAPVGFLFVAGLYLLLAADLGVTLIAFSKIADNIRMINQLGSKIRLLSDTIGDNISGGVFSVMRAKDRRLSDIDELKEKYDGLVQRNKILLNRLLRFFHPLTRLMDRERIRLSLKTAGTARRALSNKLYYSTIEELLAADCVQEMQQYKQHGDTTTYTHCLAVAYYSYRLCRVLPMKVDMKSVARGALLHDLFLYDWHIPDESHRLHGFYHPGFAYANAAKYFDINDIEADIIRKHMWPLTVTRVPRCREAAIVCLVDKFCSFSETIGLHYKKQFVFERSKE